MLPTFEVHDSNQRLAVAVPREIVGEYINDMGEVVRGLAGKPAAVVLANHGSVVVGKDGEVACNASGSSKTLRVWRF